MSGILHEVSVQRFMGEAGGVVGALMFFYLSGTTDLAPIYSDAGLTTPLANPVAVAAGEILPDIYLDSSISYRRRIVYNDGTEDDVDPLPILVSAASLAASSGSAGIGFIQAGAGAVARTVQSKLRDFVSVKDFGALGDGTTDDTAAIQTAINATASGSTLLFPEGNYRVSGVGLQINSKTDIEFISDGATITLSAVGTLATNFGVSTIRFQDCSRIGFTGFSINGNGYFCNLVALVRCVDCRITYNTLYAGGLNGQIIAGGGTRNRIEFNLIHSASVGRGVWLGNYNATDMEIDLIVNGNVFRDNLATGLVIGTVGGRISNNSCTNNAGAGMVVGGANGYSTKYITITGNYCEGNAFHGIQFDSVINTDAAADSARGITVTANVCVGHDAVGGSGIYIVNSRDCTIADNICINNQTAGIVADDNNVRLTLSSNLCTDTRTGGSKTQLVGIRCNVTNRSSSEYSIVGNQLSGNTVDGLVLSSVTGGISLSRGTVSANTICDNGSRGIEVANTVDVFDIVVAGNTVRGNTTEDIRCVNPLVRFSDNIYATETGVSFATLTNNSATPSVAGREFWLASNSSATTITALNDGYNGQVITILATNANTTIAHGGLISLPGGLNAVLPSSGVITLVRRATVWFEVSRNF